MKRALSTRNILSAKFKTAEFDGKWLDSFGTPALTGVWFVWGVSGTGKTNFLLQLAKYLTKFVPKVAYDSLEEGLSLSIQEAWIRNNIEEVGNKVQLLDREGLSDLNTRLRRKKSANVVIIDSIQKLDFKLRYADVDALIKRYPSKLFIFISQVGKSGEPKGEVALSVRHDADIKIQLEGFRGHVTTRYRTADGQGGADFVFYQDGAEAYDAIIKQEEDGTEVLTDL